MRVRVRIRVSVDEKSLSRSLLLIYRRSKRVAANDDDDDDDGINDGIKQKRAFSFPFFSFAKRKNLRSSSSYKSITLIVVRVVIN